jgi:hypothetical protein
MFYFFVEPLQRRIKFKSNFKTNFNLFEPSHQQGRVDQFLQNNDCWSGRLPRTVFQYLTSIE